MEEARDEGKEEAKGRTGSRGRGRENCNDATEAEVRCPQVEAELAEGKRGKGGRRRGEKRSSFLRMLERCQLPFQKKSQSCQKEQSGDEPLTAKVCELANWKGAKGTTTGEELIGREHRSDSGGKPATSDRNRRPEQQPGDQTRMAEARSAPTGGH
jgi:hypothetical protein